MRSRIPLTITIGTRAAGKAAGEISAYRFAESTEGANRSITPGPQRSGTRRAKASRSPIPARLMTERGMKGSAR